MYARIVILVFAELAVRLIFGMRRIRRNAIL